MKESKFIRYMITGVVCAFFLMCELTLIKYCKTSMFFMRGEVIKLSLIAGIILIPFEKIGYSLYCERILGFKSIRLYRKSVENILKEKEKTEEQKE